jgi:multidrug efflux system membrane fusion protein
MVHASDANPMLIITQLQPITAVFTLPEDQLQTVAQHMRKGPMEVDAYSRDDQTKITTGRLETIDNQIDQTTGTGKLKAVFDNKNNELWPNQFVNIHLLLETRPNVTVLPSAAVQRGPQGDYVYVVKQDKTVEVRPINVAISEGTVVQVASGVTPDEMVVTDGQDKLQSGSHVEPHFQNANADGNSEKPATPQANGNAGSAISPQSNDKYANPRTVPPSSANSNPANRGRNRQDRTNGSGVNQGTASR